MRRAIIGAAMTENLGFEWRIRPAEDQVVVELSGELDVSCTDRLKAALGELTDGRGSPRIVIDMSDLTFIDSTGLTLLVGAHRRLTEMGGTLVVERPRAGPLKVLEITGLAELLMSEPPVGRPAELAD
jgi:anti-anti-sigma factor